MRDKLLLEPQGAPLPAAPQCQLVLQLSVVEAAMQGLLCAQQRQPHLQSSSYSSNSRGLGMISMASMRMRMRRWVLGWFAALLLRRLVLRRFAAMLLLQIGAGVVCSTVAVRVADCDEHLGIWRLHRVVN